MIARTYRKLRGRDAFSRKNYNKGLSGISLNERTQFDSRFFKVRDTGATRTVTLDLNLALPVPALLSNFVSAALGYDWNEAQIVSTTGLWEINTQGLSSTGATGGSQTEQLAYGLYAWDDLPDNLFTFMRKYPNDGSGNKVHEWLFDVPLQADAATISHRDAIGDGTVTYGNREDLTLTEAQCKQFGQFTTAQRSFVGGQAAGKLGWMRTEIARAPIWDSTGDDWYGYFVDREYDVLGRGPLSESEELEVMIIDAVACS